MFTSLKRRRAPACGVVLRLGAKTGHCKEKPRKAKRSWRAVSFKETPKGKRPTGGVHNRKTNVRSMSCTLAVTGPLFPNWVLSILLERIVGGLSHLWTMCSRMSHTANRALGRKGAYPKLY